jgi:hypothetical protein
VFHRPGSVVEVIGERPRPILWLKTSGYNAMSPAFVGLKPQLPK